MGCKIDFTNNAELQRLISKHGQAKGLEIFLSDRNKNESSVTKITDSLINTQKDAIDNFIKRDSELEVETVKEENGEERHHYIYNGIDVTKTSGVQSGSEEAMKFTRKKYGKRTKDFGKDMTEASKLGSLMHLAMQHIIAFNMLDGASSEHIEFFKSKLVSNEELKNNPKLVSAIKALEKKLNPLIIQAKKEGAVLLPEISLLSLKDKIAGTIDIVWVSKDGSVKIYDLKTSATKTKLSKFNLTQYDRQVGQNYNKLISKPDGLTTTRHNIVNATRLIPARILFKYDSIKKEYNNEVISDVIIELDEDKIEGVPTYTESTNIKELDAFLGKLDNQIEQDEKKLDGLKGEKHQHKRELIYASIERKKELIARIQIKRDINIVKAGISTELNYMIKTIMDGDWDSVDIDRWKSTLKLYGDISSFLPLNIKEADEIAFSLIAGKANKLLKRINEYVVSNIIEDATNVTGIIGRGPIKDKEDFVKQGRDISNFKRFFLGVGSISNPIVAHIKKLVDLAKSRAFNKSSDLYKRLDEAKYKVVKIIGGGVDAWKVFTQLGKDDKPTGRIINEVSSLYWDEYKVKKEERNEQWFLENTIFNKELFEKRLASISKSIEARKELFKDELRLLLESRGETSTEAKLNKYAEDKVSKEINKWISINTILDNGQIIGSMEFNKPNLEVKNGRWKDKRFEYIKGNKDLYDFWKLYTGTMKELQEIAPEIKKDFIANIPASYAELVGRLGVKAASSLKIHSSTEDIFSDYDDKKNILIDESYGDPIRNIPIIGLKELHEEGYKSSELKSYDLANSLYIFADSVYKYAELLDIEDKVKGAIGLLRDQNTLEVDNKGNYIQEKYGRMKQVANSGETTNILGAINQMVRAEIYGVRKQDSLIVTLPEIKAFGKVLSKEREMDFVKIMDGFLRYVGFRNLGGNMFAPVTNALQGYTSAIITGYGNYEKKHFVRASYLTTTGVNTIDKDAIKMQLLIEKIGVTQYEFTDAWKRDLSSIKTKGINTDLAFKPMQWGESLVQNSVLGAMLMSGKYNLKWEDFSIKETIKKGKKSHELVYKDGKEELSDIIQSNFKAKVMSVNHKILGDYNNHPAIKQWFIGRALMQHRTWIPATIQSRVSRGINKETGEGWDYEMERWIEGRYTTLKNKSAWMALGKIMKGKLMFHKVSNQELMELGLEESQVNNVRQDLLEMQIIAGVYFLIMILKGAGEGDEDRSFAYRYSMRTADRLFSELTFFFNPSAMGQILISPAASISAGVDIGKIISHTSKQTYGFVTGDEEMMKKAKPLKQFRRALPTKNLDLFYGYLNSNEIIPKLTE